MTKSGILTGDKAADVFGADERFLHERRHMSWRTVFYGFMKSRRHCLRRTADADHIYKDWHHPWLFILVVGVMLMSVADAFLTLQLLDLGAREMNPLMQGLISWDTLGFVSLKMLLTALGLFALVYASQYRLFGRIRVGLLITIFFCAYSSLICHELIGLMLLSELH